MDILPNEILVHIFSYITYVNVPKYPQPNIMTLVDDRKTRPSQMLNKNGLLNPAYNILHDSTETLKNFMVNKRITNVISNYAMNVLYFKKNISIEAIILYKPQYIIAPNDTTLHDEYGTHLNYGVIYLYIRSNIKVTNYTLSYLFNLKYLNLFSNTDITNQGLLYLSELIYLNMHWNRKVTNDGIIHLKKLKYLQMPFNYNLTIYIKTRIPDIEYVDAPEYNKYIKK